MAHDAEVDKFGQEALVLMAGVDQNPRLRLYLEHGTAGVHAVHARHAQVHDHDLRRKGGGQSHGLAAAQGHARHTQMGVRGEQAAHAFHEQLVIVHQQNAADLTSGTLAHIACLPSPVSTRNKIVIAYLGCFVCRGAGGPQGRRMDRINIFCVQSE